MIETHFWGQEGAAREYNEAIWGLPSWPFADLKDKIPRDQRSSYKEAALKGIQWRFDAAKSVRAITHFTTIQVPGDTGFIAATQVFDYDLSPSHDVPGKLRVQLNLALRILTTTKVYVRPVNMPPSGHYLAAPDKPKDTKAKQEVWVVSEVDDDQKLATALQQLVQLPCTDITVFLSPKLKGDPANGVFSASLDIGFNELDKVVRQERQQVEDERQRERKEEERKEEERKRELERRRKEEEKPEIPPPPRGIIKALVAALVVVVAVLGVALFVLLKYKESPPVPPPPPPIEGCNDPRALNFDPRANAPDTSCQFYEKTLVIEGHEGAIFTDTLYWREHQFPNQEKSYRFASTGSLDSTDVSNIQQKLAIQLRSYTTATIKMLSSDTVELKIAFDNVPLGEDRLAISFDEMYSFPFSSIKITIVADDRDYDGDGMPASGDRYPFEGGRCDGVDYDGDGVDDCIDIDIDGDGVINDNDKELRTTLGAAVDASGREVQLPPPSEAAKPVERNQSPAARANPASDSAGSRPQTENSNSTEKENDEVNTTSDGAASEGSGKGDNTQTLKPDSQNTPDPPNAPTQKSEELQPESESGKNSDQNAGGGADNKN